MLRKKETANRKKEFDTKQESKNIMPGYDSTARLPFATGGRVGAKEGKYITKKTKSKAWITKKDRSTQGKDVPTMASKGGRIGLKKGGDDKWIQKVDASIKRRGTKGKCTPITKPGCTGRAKALAKTFKKMAAKRKKS